MRAKTRIADHGSLNAGKKTELIGRFEGAGADTSVRPYRGMGGILLHMG